MALWILLAALAAALIFLTQSSQEMLPKRPWRVVGLSLLLVSLLAISSYLPINYAFFAWLVIMVAAISCIANTDVLADIKQPLMKQ